MNERERVLNNSRRPNAKHTVVFISLMGCVLLALLSSNVMKAAVIGVDTWLNFVMPALFPFFVCTALMRDAGFIGVLCGKRRKPGKFLPRGTFPLFIVSLISGAPSGARLCAMMNDDGIIDSGNITRFCALCNMLSPMFIIGTVATGMLSAPIAALPIAIGHYLSCFIVLLVIYAIRPIKNSRACNTMTSRIANTQSYRFLPSFSRALGDSCISVIKICGAIVFFMVISSVIDSVGIISILLKPFSIIGINTQILKAVFLGMLEIVGGCRAVAGITGIDMPMRCALLSFLITFGGVCVMAQSASFADIKSAKYLLLKFMCGVLAAAITYTMALLILPDSIETLSGINVDTVAIAQNAFAASGVFFASLLGMCAVVVVCCAVAGRRAYVETKNEHGGRCV